MGDAGVEEEAGDADEEAAQGIDDEFGAFDGDAAEAGGVFVGADGDDNGNPSFTVAYGGSMTMIVTPSQVVRRQVIQRFHISPYRMVAVPEAAAPHLRPADLETALQLTYLTFTQPTRDADGFAALKKRNIDVPYMVKDNEGHGFHNEENRFEFYEAMEKFLARHLEKK